MTLPWFEIFVASYGLWVLVACATFLGFVGLMFGYFILLPRAVHWLTNFDSHQFRILIRARDYYSFTSTVLLGIVATFARAAATKIRCGRVFARNAFTSTTNAFQAASLAP